MVIRGGATLNKKQAPFLLYKLTINTNYKSKNEIKWRLLVNRIIMIQWAEYCVNKYNVSYCKVSAQSKNES